MSEDDDCALKKANVENGEVDESNAPSHTNHATDDGASEAFFSFREVERFKTWRKHTRDLYQQAVHIEMTWPTYSAQLLPYIEMEDQGVARQAILCGTKTGNAEQNYVMLAALTLPRDSQYINSMEYIEALGEIGGYGFAPPNAGFKIERRMYHDGDVHCARYMPANPWLIATASSDGFGYIFDWSRIPMAKEPNNPPRPRLPPPMPQLSENPSDEEKAAFRKNAEKYKALEKEQEKFDRKRGKGQHMLQLVAHPPNDRERQIPLCGLVAWDTSKRGQIAAGCEGCVCLWEIDSLNKDRAGSALSPMTNIELPPTSAVNDLCFLDPNSLVLLSDTQGVVEVDLRSKISSATCLTSNENRSLTCLAASPFYNWLFAAGTENGNSVLFDRRKIVEPIATFPLHTSSVTQIEWCPHASDIFATGGQDGVCVMYDATKQTSIFHHFAHTAPIFDLHWSWQESFAGQMVSCDMHAISVWKPRDTFFKC